MNEAPDVYSFEDAEIIKDALAFYLANLEKEIVSLRSKNSDLRSDKIKKILERARLKGSDIKREDEIHEDIVKLKRSMDDIRFTIETSKGLINEVRHVQKKFLEHGFVTNKKKVAKDVRIPQGAALAAHLVSLAQMERRPHKFEDIVSSSVSRFEGDMRFKTQSKGQFGILQPFGFVLHNEYGHWTLTNTGAEFAEFNPIRILRIKMGGVDCVDFIVGKYRIVVPIHVFIKGFWTWTDLKSNPMWGGAPPVKDKDYKIQDYSDHKIMSDPAVMMIKPTKSGDDLLDRVFKFLGVA